MVSLRRWLCLHYRPLVSEPELPAAELPDRTTGRKGSPYARLRSPSALRAWVDYVALAVLAFVPMVAAQPGVVTDDTKTYLYLDPGRYIRQAVSLWDPHVGLGTVTHENIGYLLPMGPFYWVLAELHVPLWVAQRLWMGCLLYAAGAGALYLCRVLGLEGPGRYVTTVAFMFTPYVLQYSGRISVILMPWAGLPWMLAFVVLALRKGGWRYPALFALVVALVSGINASSLLYVGIAPALWLPYAVLVAEDSTWRKAWSVAWKVAGLTVLVSIWWAVGLQIEAAYGVNVLKYTETVPATSGASLASEVLRGLGYWYFYGTDRAGPWTQTSVAYTQNIALILWSFSVPLLAFLAAFVARWRYRTYFILITVVGTVMAVGPNPYEHPSSVGSVIKKIMVDTTAGLAMRSTDRASPLIILSMALFLGAGVSALSFRVRRTSLAIGALAVAAVAGASSPLWTGQILANGFNQPTVPPAYTRAAAAGLDKAHPGTRLYALPGNNFGAQRWGDTIDTVYPGLMTRPFTTHEQQIMGSLPTADVLEAVDGPLQNGVMNWDAMGPMASLLSAGDVLVQYDQAYERYDTPNPQSLANQLTTTPAGLVDPVPYGKPRPNVPLVPHFSEGSLSLPANPGWPAPLVSYTVTNPRPIVRTESTATPLVVAGDANGVVAIASVGLLSGNPMILYSGTLDTNAALKRATLAKPANLVVTDTNRKQGYRWNSLNENTGYTETAAQGPDKADPSDAPLDLFAGAPVTAHTTTVLNGVSSVTASSYGSSITYLPEDRPAAALDGNPQTAWLTNSFTDQIGQWWQVVLDKPRTEHQLLLAQPQTGDPDRHITRVTLTFDGGHPVSLPLSLSSRAAAGQIVTFPVRTFTRLRITLSGVTVDDPRSPVGSRSSVGFAEVGIPGVSVDETVSMPQDLLRAAGVSSQADRLTLAMTRLRSSGTPARADVEHSLQRTFWLPTARTFSLVGQARISPLIPDDEIDRLVGRPGSDYTGTVAYSLGRLPNDLRSNAMATLDHNPATVWQPGFGSAHQAGQWLQYHFARSVNFGHLDLQIVADGRHSVPTQLTISADSGQATVTLPALANSSVAGAVVDLPIDFPTLHGRSVRITVDKVHLQKTLDYYSQTPIALAIGIATVDFPGISSSPLPTYIPSFCRNDLVTVDANPVWVQVSGTTADALDRKPLNVTLCGPNAGGLTLGPGDHTLRSALGQTAAYDVDQLVLDSAPGGGAMPLASPSFLAAPTVTHSPAVVVASQTATTIHASISGLDTSTGATPFELVLGESINRGWTATVNGGPGLGKPVLIDSFANGWRIDSAPMAAYIHHGQLAVTLSWAPQKTANWAVLVSLVAIIGCLVLTVWPVRRRRRQKSAHGPGITSVSRAADALVPSAEEAASERALLVDQRPKVQIPFGSEGPRAALVVAIVAAGIAGLVAGAIASPVAGVCVAGGTLVVLVVPKLRFLIGLAAVGCVAGAGIYVAVHQNQNPVPDNGAWPQSFGVASKWAWAGVVLLGADGVVDAVLRARIRHLERQRTGTGVTGARPVDPNAGTSNPDDRTVPVDE
jgi:arabinofuranan 3-O-arabinosyltransferase